MAWRIDGGPRNPAALAWLQSLARQADGRWLPAAGTPAQAGDTSLQLLAGEQPLAALRLGAAQVWWCDSTRCLQAPLGAEALRRLQKELPR